MENRDSAKPRRGRTAGRQHRANADLESHRIRVLHIEDNPEQAMLIRMQLTANETDPFSVEWIPTVLEGTQRASKPGVDVVLLDLGMPELVGHRTHTAIRAASPDVPIVILTGDDRSISRELAMRCDAARRVT